MSTQGSLYRFNYTDIIEVVPLLCVDSELKLNGQVDTLNSNNNDIYKDCFSEVLSMQNSRWSKWELQMHIISENQITVNLVRIMNVLGMVQNKLRLGSYPKEVTNL